MALSVSPVVNAQLLSVSSRTTLPSRRVAIRCQAEPIRRPVASEAVKPVVVATPPSSSSALATESSSSPTSGGVTLEFQRQAAKELVAYFQEKKFEEEAREGRVLGFTKKNEIGNGRWTMFGLAVGVLTEYATGVDFPEQLSIILSNLGIVD